MTERRRRLVLWGLLTAAAVCLTALWWGGPRPAAAPPAPEAEPAALPLAQLAELPSGPDLPPAVQRYLEATAYPPDSGRLTADKEGLLNPNQRYERERTIRDTFDDPAGVVTYEFSADRFDLTEADDEVVWLVVRRDGAPVDLGRIEGVAQAEGRAGPEGEPIELAFRNTGERWEAPLPLDALADHFGFFTVEARFEYAEGRTHREVLRFFHTPDDRIPARFDGRFHDYVRDGGLRVEVGVDVETPGFYRLDANFFGSGGAPVAFAAFKGELEAGTRMVPLEVYGKVLRDAGVDAPYTLSELRGYRFVDGGFPDRETIPAHEGQWITGRYALGEFTDADWDSPHKRRMIELMLQDEAAGVGVEVPPLAGEDAPAAASPSPTNVPTPAPRRGTP